MTNEQGILAQVKQFEYGDSTNRDFYVGEDEPLVGLSAEIDEVTLIGTDSFPLAEDRLPTSSRPALFIAHKAEHDNLAAFPTRKAAEEYGRGGRGGSWMVGGNVVLLPTSDGMKEVKIFDRKENRSPAFPEVPALNRLNEEGIHQGLPEFFCSESCRDEYKLGCDAVSTFMSNRFKKHTQCAHCASPVIQINGYGLAYNTFWSEWQASHPNIGGNLEQFATYPEACDYARRG